MFRPSRVTSYLFVIWIFAVSAAAQSTAFTYQGVLKDTAAPANGNYDFQFELYDAATSGSQIGPPILINAVPVTNGTFAVNLDFGNQFNGANRYLLIRVKAPFGSMTPLSPRQLITSTPNALNANLLGGLSPSAYIQNTTNQQTNTNLSISGKALFGGNVGVGTLTPTANLNVVGKQPPPPPNPGNGTNAENSLEIIGGKGGNTNGQFTSDVAGNGANLSIRGGDGGENPVNAQNDGFGGSVSIQPGVSRAPGKNGNLIIAKDGGKVAMGTATPASATLTVVNPTPGITNPSLANIPPAAIRGDATATANSTIGVIGIANSVGGIGVIGLTNGTGDPGKGGDASAVLAISTSTTGETRGVSTEVSSPDGTALDMHMPTGGSGFLIYASTGVDGGFHRKEGNSSTKFTVNANGQVFAEAGIWAKGFHLNSTNADLLENGNFITGGTVTANAVETTSNITVGGQIFGSGSTLNIGSNVNLNGTLTPQLLSGGDNHLCNLTGTSTLRFCSSSLRYKTNVRSFSRGMDLIRQLNPISFDWKENGLQDIGLAAEDVKKAEPRLTFDNPSGEVEGVKYSNLSAVFVNAFKEQQAQIDAQNKLIVEQTNLLTRLTREVRSLKQKVNSRRR